MGVSMNLGSRIGNILVKGYDRRLAFQKDMTSGMKFLIESLLMLPKEAIQYFKKKDKHKK